MPTPPRTDEKCRVALEAYKAHDYNYTNAAKALDWSVSTLKNCVTDAIRRGIDPSIVGTAPIGHHVHGVSTLYDADGKPITQWVKTRYHSSPEDIAETLVAALADIKGYAKLPPAPKHPDEHLATIYPLSDWHVGLLAWGKETGTDYDLTIAQRVIGDAMATLISQSRASKQAVVLGLGDLLHSDNYENRTSRSQNVLDVDGRYPKVLRVAIRLVVQTIDYALQKHEKVLVRILPGNHDDQSAIAVTEALTLFYSNNDRVEVDDDPGRFWWWRWGQVFLGATHGDLAKMKELPLVMAQRRPEEWGKTKHRYIYTGHIHTQTGVEVGGVPVQSFRTPAAGDAWQHGMGFGAGRSVVSITHHQEHGEVGRNTWPIVGERLHGTGYR